MQVVAVMGLLIEAKKLPSPSAYNLHRGVGLKLRGKTAAEVRTNRQVFDRTVQDRLTWVPY